MKNKITFRIASIPHTVTIRKNNYMCILVILGQYADDIKSFKECTLDEMKTIVRNNEDLIIENWNQYCSYSHLVKYITYIIDKVIKQNAEG